MFWKFNNSSSSQIDTLLKEDVTLQDLMDEEDIINECKVHNKPLIEYLSKPEVMEELVALTCEEPSPDLDERSRFKYPNIACELLTCDIPVLNERLASDNTLLEKLYSFLSREPPLNPLMASFFSKIMGALIAKKTEQNWLSNQFTCLQVLEFLKAKDDFISLLLNHLGTSAIMDLTLKLMTQVEGVEVRQNILNWLDSQNIIKSLVSLMNPKVDEDRHYNVAQLLCDFVKLARDVEKSSMESNPLLDSLESSETVSLLLNHILEDEKSETAIVGGIKIILTLLDVNKPSIPKFDSQNIYDSSSYDEPPDTEHREHVVQNVSQSLHKRLKDLHDLLLTPPKKAPIETTVGVLDVPLGNTRLHVTKLIAAMIAGNNGELVQELVSLGTMQVLLDLFFKYQWSNFLHTQVEVCITSALKTHILSQEMGDCNALSKHLLVNCKLVDRILDAWKENDVEQSQHAKPRKGYMGHLISIANQLVVLCSTTSLGEFLKISLPETADALEQFKNTTLQEVNTTQETLLGGVHPNISNENNDDFGNIPFLQTELVQQQMFSQYQMQQLTPHIIETYGFSDDDFNGGDDTLQTIDQRTDMDFDLSEGDIVQQHELFKQICAQNINTLDDVDDQIFEDRDHTFQTVIEKSGEGHDTVYSSDSEDDSPQPNDDAEDAFAWGAPLQEPSAITSDPWGGDTKVSNSSDNWADFSSMSFEAFSSELKSQEEKIEKPDVFKAKEGELENIAQQEGNVPGDTEKVEVISEEKNSEASSNIACTTSEATSEAVVREETDNK